MKSVKIQVSVPADLRDEAMRQAAEKAKAMLQRLGTEGAVRDGDEVNDQ